MAYIVAQRDILNESILTVLEVEVLWFASLLGLFWLILPLTAISYKLISPKPKRLKIVTTTLAHLAGSGPGRIIPGGVGNLSISALHLKKTGLTIEQSVGVVLTNNIFGMASNALLLLIVLVIRPETTQILTDSISSDQIFIVLFIIFALVVLTQWLFHARGTRKELLKTSRQWRKILRNFIGRPKHVVGVAIIALTISLLHTFMLDFSAFALGVNISITDALVAMSFGVVIGSIFPTPGGVGGVEAGITAAFIVLGLPATEAASIAVLFRVATYWQPLLPGTLAYLYLREKKLL